MSDQIALDPIVRPEQAGDEAVIYELTERAFAPMPFAGGDEQDLINALRDAGALEISLVAENEGQIVGHVAFSPAFAADGAAGWYALGPVSVDPEMQKIGMGSLLIKQGLAMLHDRDASGCILVGNPKYYARFGFEPAPENCPKGEPAEYYQILAINAKRPTCVVDFHKTFHAETD